MPSLEQTFRSLIPIEAHERQRVIRKEVDAPEVGARWGRPAQFTGLGGDAAEEGTAGHILVVPRGRIIRGTEVHRDYETLRIADPATPEDDTTGLDVEALKAVTFFCGTKSYEKMVSTHEKVTQVVHEYVRFNFPTQMAATDSGSRGEEAPTTTPGLRPSHAAGYIEPGSDSPTAPETAFPAPSLPEPIAPSPVNLSPFRTLTDFVSGGDELLMLAFAFPYNGTSSAVPPLQFFFSDPYLGDFGNLGEGPDNYQFWPWASPTSSEFYSPERKGAFVKRGGISGGNFAPINIYLNLTAIKAGYSGDDPAGSIWTVRLETNVNSRADFNTSKMYYEFFSKPPLKGPVWDWDRFINNSDNYPASVGDMKDLCAPDVWEPSKKSEGELDIPAPAYSGGVQTGYIELTIDTASGTITFVPL